MKKIIITAAVGIGLISLIPNSNFNKRKDNNLLLLSTKNISENIKEDINPFWFDYVTERVNIVTTSGKILNYEYFQGITGMRTNLPSGYAPIGYKIIGIRVNGENLTSKEVKEYKVPQILGDKDITIDYIVKLVDYTAIVKVHNKDGKIITEKSLGEKGSKIKYPTIDKGTKIISVTVNGKEIPISEIPKVINNKNLNIDIFTENKYKKPIKPSTDGDKKPDVVKPIKPSTDGDKKPDVVKPIKPSTGGDKKPDVVKPIKPSTGGDKKPDVVKPIKPSTGGDKKPDVVKPIKPSTDGDKKPDVVKPIKPSTGGDKKTAVAKAIKPSTGGDKKPDVVKPIKPSTDGDKKPDVVKPIKPSTGEDKKPDMAKQSENEKDESLVNTNKSIIKKIVKDISNKTNNSIKTGAVIVPNIKAEIGSETKKEFIFHEPAINENILNLVNKVQKTKLEKPLESENNKMENLKRVGLLAATAIMSIISALMLLSNPKK